MAQLCAKYGGDRIIMPSVMSSHALCKQQKINKPNDLFQRVYGAVAMFVSQGKICILHSLRSSYIFKYTTQINVTTLQKFKSRLKSGSDLSPPVSNLVATYHHCHIESYACDNACSNMTVTEQNKARTTVSTHLNNETTS